MARPIGCSSRRRQLQLKALFPQASVVPVRGNVQTRLSKLDGGQFSALVLAAAGLKRLGLEQRICRYFTTEEILPAAGQGIIAVQCRKGTDCSWLEAAADPDAAACALAERAFVRQLDGGCSSPVAAYGQVQGGQLLLTVWYTRSLSRREWASQRRSLPWKGRSVILLTGFVRKLRPVCRRASEV